VRGDGRARRMVVVPDSVLNPAPGEPDRLTELAEDDWGLIALPPAGLGDADWRAWVDPIVDQVATFLADGYEVAICSPPDDGIERFRAALRSAGWTIDREL
jgi:hypothetical protein